MEARWNARKKEADAEFWRLHHIVRSRQEEREVECCKVHDTASAEVRIVRWDNNEVVERRPMTPAEWQRRMTLDEGEEDEEPQPCGTSAMTADYLQAAGRKEMQESGGGNVSPVPR